MKVGFRIYAERPRAAPWSRIFVASVIEHPMKPRKDLGTRYLFKWPIDVINVQCCLIPAKITITESDIVLELYFVILKYQIAT